MLSKNSKGDLKLALLTTVTVLLLAVASFAQQQINLTAEPTSVTLPDGSVVPMWGYSCGASNAPGTCEKLNPTAVGWSPVVITVPTSVAGGLTINLTNSLPVPTSITIVGQLGGGLGTPGSTTPSPAHGAQSATWPVSDPGTTNTPPSQGNRVQSFSTEVGPGATTLLPAWANLRLGTYLIESGTHPSIQGPMGLFGMLVVTDTVNSNAYPNVHYDADVRLLFSEIDPVQNTAVNTAVNTSGFSETRVWSGQPGGCGNPDSGAVYNTCYPPAVNYSPRYYLINGVAFDKTHASASLFGANPSSKVTGSVLVRMVNAGLRMHVPSIVGSQTGASAGSGFSLIAEDGNPLPGLPRVQSEVFMAAGKTYDVMVNVPAASSSALPIYDRALGLSGNATTRDAGMLAYISINGAGLPSVGAFTATATAADDLYNSVIAGHTLTVSDPSQGVIANDINVYNVKVATQPTKGQLTLNTNGTFTYVPNSGWAGSDSFTYQANGSGPIAKVTLNECTAGNGCKEAASGITARDDTYTSTIATTLSIKSPGVLANDSDTAGYPLTAVLVGTPSGVTLNPDGSFTATVPAHPGGPATLTFNYRAQNSQGTLSNVPAATVTVTFSSPSGLAVIVVDGQTKAALSPQDYRWLIEEDRTFYTNPNNTTNTGTANVPTLGTNFHASYMPVIAQGCMGLDGAVSCETGQYVLDTRPACISPGVPTGCSATGGQHVPAACDLGNGVCRTDASQKTSVDPKNVVLDPTKRYYLSVLPGDGQGDANGVSHAMGGTQLAFINGSWRSPLNPTVSPVQVIVEPTPLPTATVSVFVFEDDFPTNGEHDSGGGIDVLATNEPGLGGFNITLQDDVGGTGDASGQMTYDMFNQPLSNSLAGTIDPTTGLDACPISKGARTGVNGDTGLPDTSPTGITGMIPVCPKYEADGITLSPLAGHAVITKLPPGRYGVVATPGADAIARGEEWLQTNTLDGGKALDSFIKAGEPAFFQEYGPAGYHVAIGFANPAIINARKPKVCAGTTCNSSVTGTVTGVHMSRTPDERLYSSGSRDTFGYTQCFASLGSPKGADFAFAKCDDQGVFNLTGIPAGDWRVTIFDQWNDQIVDGISTPVRVGAGNVDMGEVAVHAWRTNLYTRTFLDQNGDGVSNVDPVTSNPTEPGLTLASTNIRFRDGSYSNFNNTDLAGFAGFNEIFPLFNWYVVETTSTRYKNTGTHVIYDAGGPVDGSSSCGQPGYPPCGTSGTGANFARTKEDVPLPANLRVPGARYCANADCPAGDTAGGSTGRVDPAWVTTEGWQGFIGQSSFIEFGKKPFAEGENGGISGHVVYASTRPFDDPALLLQLSWEPLVPHVTINLYQVGAAPDGSQSMKLVDTTQTSSWDDWAQGFHTDPSDPTKLVPNMNCPGQSGAANDPFFFTLFNQPFALNPNTPLPNNSQFKCFDGLHNFNQVQPAPYDGMYSFPSVTARDPGTGAPTGTNCTICVNNPTGDGTKMLPAGKYVVEMIVPPGYELVKEEDKNILLGDLYNGPVTNQFLGFGNIFIMPDQAAVAAAYNPNNPLIPTTNFGAPRHEGDTGSIETFWPCVGAARVVPDYMSIFPQSGQNAPFAGATRNLCDRKEVVLEDQSSVLAKFYVFTSTHVAGHFTGLITDDFTAEFDPFSPSFGEKFAPPNLPVSVKDFAGNEVARVYADQWGAYNGLNFSSYGVNPPDPSGFVPQMMVFCMNDIGDAAHPDALYQPQYSQFCYETPFMPGQTQYMDTPVVPTSAFAGAGYNNPDCAYPDATPAIKQVNGDGVGPYVSAPGHTLTITALGDQTVNNYGYSGPSATAAPFNQKTVTRHYGFGSTPGTVAIVGSDGVAHPLTGQINWSDTTISGAVPNNVPLCTNPQQQAQYGGSNARCGELVITAANGKRSVDTVTVTIGGKAPTVVAPGQTIQSAIDGAQPGDLIIVPPGVYKEFVIMWKPVRLQGVGAASTVIDGSTHPAEVLQPWRQKMVCLFGLALNGQPLRAPNGTDPGNPFDPDGAVECGSSNGTGWFGFQGGPNNPQVDRIPLEGILGWNTQTNGNLAEQLQEPTLLGAYEGAGITIVGKGVRYPAGADFIFGNGPDTGTVATAGQFPLGTNLLTSSDADCNTATTGYSSNFLCNPSRIDGLSVTNSSQGGGGILAHAWAHNVEISNNRVYNNTGSLSGGISIGIGEVPDALLSGNNGDPVGFDQQPWTCIPGAVVNGVQNVSPPGRADGQELPFCYDRNVNVHHNAITSNSSIGDELFSATPAGAGGITFCPGSDGYKLTQNWVCGNLSTGDGGGVAHLGYSENGLIDHNSILFNQSTNPTTASNGGGIIVMTTAPDGLNALGQECGSITDVDCPPALGDGAGPGLVINANLIQGNAAESGSGGGIRFQGVNGTEISRFPLQPNQWYEVNVTNNIIANNVAGWSGAGVSLQDSLKVNLINNTIVSNDTTASSGALFNTFRAGEASAPPPTGATCSGPNCSLSNPQPAGVAADGNSSNLISALPALVLCPAGHSDGLTNPLIPIVVPNGKCRSTSFPILYNDLIWKNRAFHLSVGSLSPQYQQSVVSLVPTLSQPQAGGTTANGSGQIVTGGTGACVTTGINNTGNVSYWDIGVAGDTGATNHGSGVTLAPVSSVLSSGGYAGNHNGTADPTLVRQYCNGSRIPPEFAGTGYQVPPGTNEGNVPVPIFNLQANATVDEANNWVNIGWGPLSMTNPSTGALLSNYAMAGSSPYFNYINIGNSTFSYNAAPAFDFFNSPRKNDGAVAVGAVEGAGNAGGGGTLSVSPTALAFGNVVANNNSAIQTLTLSNTTGSTQNIVIAPATTSPAAQPNVFTRILGNITGLPADCGASLANNASCTIAVRFTPAAAPVSYTGNVTISAAVGVLGSPVVLTGAGVAVPAKPPLGLLDNFNRADASTLGGNWTQPVVPLLGAAIRVNTNQASAATAGGAQWNGGFGAKEGAAFTIANATFNNDALVLDANGALVANIPTNFIRVQYAGGTTVNVQTTTNNGMGYTTAGTLNSTFANGDTITAVADATNAVSAPTVYVWRTTSANVTTFVGAVQITPNAVWQGNGVIGMQLPGGARVDNFSGGAVP